MIYYVTAMKPNDANHKPCHWDINNLFAITTVTDKHRDIKVFQPFTKLGFLVS